MTGSGVADSPGHPAPADRIGPLIWEFSDFIPRQCIRTARVAIARGMQFRFDNHQIAPLKTLQG